MHNISWEMNKYLESERIKLRALEPEDLQKLYEWENDDSAWEVGGSLLPYSRFVLRNYIEHSGESIYETGQLRLIIERIEDGMTLGTIDLYAFEAEHMKAGVGILIDSKIRNQGYGLEAIELLKKYAFQVLHLHQLYAKVSVYNIQSQRLFEVSGFEKTALLKDWIQTQSGYSDVFLFQMINKDRSIKDL